MQHRNHEKSPVGVVPRRRAPSIHSLTSDAPEACAVAEEVESPPGRRSAPLAEWLSGAATFGLVAAALEWLKLTR